MARALAVAAAVAALTLGSSSPGFAHALVRSSDPADGARLEVAPSAVTVDFTEAPDPKLSSVDVLDGSGASVASAGSVLVDGSHAIRVAVGPLDTGVYSAVWRVISRVDGHLTAGTIVFGVGVDPAGAAPRVAEASVSTSALGVAGRAVLYAGLVLLLGAAWMWLFAFQGQPARVLSVLPPAWLVAGTGLALLAAGQRVDAGVGFGDLLGTSVGRALVLRAVPLAAAAVGIAMTVVVDKRVRAVGVTLSGVAAVVVMVEHVASGHAGAGDASAVKIAVQSIHFAAVGVWIGGLAALLAGLRGLDEDSAHTAARRFSTVAAFALAVVAATGVLRAVNEVGAWSRLLSTPFGRIVCVKALLVVGLGVLGAVNRYRNVGGKRWRAVEQPDDASPSRARRAPRLHTLRRVGALEVVVAAVVLSLTGLLASSAPATAVAGDEEAGPSAVVAEATNFARTISVRLTVTPGLPGPNEFRVVLTDPQTKRRLDADGVRLRVSYPVRPDAGESELSLQPDGVGEFAARSAAVSIGGRWRVAVLVERGIDSEEIVLPVTTRIPDRDVSVIEAPGQPTLYTVPIDEARSVQVYADPSSDARVEVHATFFEGGTELPMEEISMIAIPPEGDAFALTSRRFGPGHFIAPLSVRRGAWRFDMIATTAGGERVSAQVVIEVGS